MGEKRKTFDNVFLHCGGRPQTRSNDNDMLVLTRHFCPDLSLASQTMLQSIAERESTYGSRVKRKWMLGEGRI